MIFPKVVKQVIVDNMLFTIIACFELEDRFVEAITDACWCFLENASTFFYYDFACFSKRLHVLKKRKEEEKSQLIDVTFRPFMVSYK